MRWKVYQTAILIILSILISCEKKETFSNKTEIKNKITSVYNDRFRLKPAGETAGLYQWYCAQCHGINGEGNGINAIEMPVRPLNHTDAAIMSKKSDQDLFKAILKGGLAIGRAPCMPPWENTLERKTIASLVGYLRELCNCEYSA